MILIKKIIEKIKNAIWFFKNFNLIKDTIKIKNSKKNKNLFIFGNGKSLNNLDNKKINNYLSNDFDLICMNNFLISDLAKNLNPTFYLIADLRIFQPLKSDFSKEKVEETLQMHKILEKKNTTIFMPSDFLKKNPFSNKTFYFNNNFSNFTKNITDITKSNNLFSLSGIKAIMIGLYLGYENIYLCGLDNDQWKYSSVDENNNIISDSRYFYQNKNFHINKEKHMSNYLKTYSDIFKSYERFKNFKIYNLDKLSLINCFSKKTEIDVFK